MKKIDPACLLIVCCLFLLSISCQKGQTGNPPPVNPPDTTHPVDEKARFNIVASDCSTIVFDSTYFTGEAINNADSIQIKVDVSKTGTWTYNSDTVNGISFSGKGHLNSLGQQFISIAANGTPALPGNTLLSFKNDTSQINMYVPVIEKNVANEPVLGDSIYFKVTIDNVDYSYSSYNVDPSQLAYVSDIRHDSLVVASYVNPAVYPNPPGTGSIGIQGNLYGIHTTNPSEDDFKRLFQPGASPFSIDYCNLSSRGMIVFWTGDNDQSWATYYDSQQDGSYFKIVGVTDGHDSKGKYYVKVKMRFKCKLYSYNSPGMKQLTNGEMVGYFFKPQ